MNDAMAYLTQGVYVIGVNSGTTKNLMTAAWMTQISANALLVAVGKRHYTAELIEQAGHFGVSVLTMEQKEIALHCGKHSGRTTNKLAGLSLTETEDHDPLIEGAAAHFACSVFKIVDGMDHILFCAKVNASQAFNKTPMQYHQEDFF